MVSTSMESSIQLEGLNSHAYVYAEIYDYSQGERAHSVWQSVNLWVEGVILCHYM